jgi:hypothetical protein
MYKHYDFAKIYEAEQTGTPLNPEDMGMESVDNSTEPKLEDFEALKNKGYQIEIMLTSSDINGLLTNKTLVKNDTKWKNINNQTDIKEITSLIINVGDTPFTKEQGALIFKIDSDTAQRITDSIKEGGTVTESFRSTSPSIIDGITINFIKSNEVTPDDETNVEPASDEQIAAGSVTPEPTEGVIAETKSIMNFNQFVSESKKVNWIADAVKGMEKGALKKDLKVKEGEKVTKSKIAKKEAELKKKDKDKKKPGLQLNLKDAKTHKRDILAVNLLNAQKSKK